MCWNSSIGPPWNASRPQSVTLNATRVIQTPLRCGCTTGILQQWLLFAHRASLQRAVAVDLSDMRPLGVLPYSWCLEKKWGVKRTRCPCKLSATPETVGSTLAHDHHYRMPEDSNQS